MRNQTFLIACGIAALSATAVCVGSFSLAAQDQDRSDPPATLEPMPAPAPAEPEARQSTPEQDGEPRSEVNGKPAKPDQPYHLRVLGHPPKSPRQTAEVLTNLYALLATASDEKTGTEIAGVIERLWLFGHGDTVFVLMQRANKALAEKNDALALRFLDAVVALAPDYTEGWHQRAVVHYTQNDFARALGDLRRVLALDPNHYKALEGLSRMLEETGQKAGALAAHRQLMTVNPFWPDGEQRLRELERETEGQGI
ncbi:MAG: tetratricopeptide repeat protein [Alphaproteobacteria bacterium]|nr:tetratricopeptide repeat protein [Alphaproteobacteria bacterium]